MIVTCPNCQTRYRVDDTELGAATERRMRCASCGHLWRYSIGAANAFGRAAAEATPARPAAAPLRQEPEPPVVPPFRFEIETDPQRYPGGPAAQPQPQPPVPAELPSAARRRGQRATGVLLVITAVGLVLAAILARDLIVLLFPATAPVYETLHLVAPAGSGLEITVAEPQHSTDSLTVEGDIVNRGSAVQTVPRLEVTLRNGGGTYLDSRVIEPPARQLQPGATAHFSAVFQHPSITAIGAEVTFATQ
jgi:predicted Zn finger-like uncharacterized protein